MNPLAHDLRGKVGYSRGNNSATRADSTGTNHVVDAGELAPFKAPRLVPR
jgi:hypothetical protein